MKTPIAIIKAQYSDCPVNRETPIGTQVKHSGYSVRPKRDWYLSRGRASEKSAAKDDLDRFVAMRGVLVEHLSNGCRVEWDNGSESRCLSHMIVTA